MTKIIKSKQKLARLIAMYLFVIFLASGLYSCKQDSNGKYDKWTTTTEGVVQEKVANNSKFYLKINSELVLVNADTYKDTKLNEKVSLGHTSRETPILIAIHILFSVGITGMLLFIFGIAFVRWALFYSDEMTFLNFLKG